MGYSCTVITVDAHTCAYLIILSELRVDCMFFDTQTSLIGDFVEAWR